ncbi:PLP-dependent aminotransferase family protein [Nocardioides sp. BGMRC 2183]|nr:PLP-dependent aminotransferase family protein [Nocardioides sp. BGMRC 2183]
MPQPRRPCSVGADFLQLDTAHAPARDLTGWLTAQVRAAVADGRLPAGVRLPATRTLAQDLGVSRGVVVEAYRRLADEGLVDTRTSAGTRVRALAPTPAPAAPPDTLVLPADRLPPIPRSAASIDLSPGVPDLAAFPRAAWLRAERAVLAEATATDLRYGDPRGNHVLRAELATWLARTRGVQVEPGGLVVVAGVAQSLALLAHVLQANGDGADGIDTIAIEDPGSRGAREQLQHWGMATPAVTVDSEGLRVDELAALRARDGGPVRAVVVTPAHQYPTGVALSPQRRRDLLAWAAAGDGGPGLRPTKGGRRPPERRTHHGAAGPRLIVEDDYDAEHRYDRAPVPALQAAAPELVAHTGSTSKSLAPGMRLGWLAPPARLLADLAAAKHAFDLGSPALPQLVLARLLAVGDYDRHLRRVRVRQRQRRDAMVAALRDLVPGGEVTGLAAGLHLLVLLPDHHALQDDQEIVDRLAEVDVIAQPLSWHRTAPGPPGLVLGYAAHPPDRLREAISRLARVLS